MRGPYGEHEEIQRALAIEKECPECKALPLTQCKSKRDGSPNRRPHYKRIQRVSHEEIVAAGSPYDH